MVLPQDGYNVRNTSLLLIVVFIGVAAFFNTYHGIFIPEPLGQDTILHLRLVRGWMRGDNPLATEHYFNQGYPYPPSMHITFALISSAFNLNPKYTFRFFQIIFLPLILTVMAYVVNKYLSMDKALIVVLLLGSSIAFWDRNTQAIPHTLDTLLIPLLVLFYIECRKHAFTLLGVYLMYNHSLYPGLLLLSLLAHDLGYRYAEMTKSIVSVFAFFLPFILFAHAPNAVSEAMRINSTQELYARTSILYSLKYLGYPLAFILVTMPLWWDKVNFRNPLVEIVPFWVLGYIPLIVWYPDRMLQYLTVPLSVVAVSKFRFDRWLITLLFFFAIMMQTALFVALVLNGQVILPMNNLLPFPMLTLN